MQELPMAMAVSSNNMYSVTSMNIDTPKYTQKKRCPKEEPTSPQLEQDNRPPKEIAYVQKLISDPANTIVQHQIQGNTAKMLVMFPGGEQRLITFDIPNENCTVHDLLDQIKLPFSEETLVSLIDDSTLGINYIVEVGYRACDTSHKTNDQADCNSIQEVVSSTTDSKSSLKNANVLDKISNPSLQHNKISYKKNNKRNVTKLEKIDQDNSSRKRLRGDDESTTFKPKVIKQEPECLTVSSDEEDNCKKIGTNSNIVLSNVCNSFDKNIDTVLEKKPIITDTSIFNSSCNDDMKSKERHLRKVLEEAEISSVKMSQLLCRMRDLAQNKISESALQCFQRLLFQTEAISTGSKQSLEPFAAFANLVNNLSASNNVASVSSNSQNIQQQLSTIIDRLERLLARQPTWHPSQHGIKSRSLGQMKRLNCNSELCWYHARYGNNAKKCVTPCSWNYGFKQGN